MNVFLSFVIYFILILIGSFFNVLAIFYNKLPNKNSSFNSIFLISLFFGIMAFAIKIPTVFYFGKLMNSIENSMFILFCFSIAVFLYSKFILKEKIYFVTYLSFALIVLILLIHSYLIYQIKHHN